MDHLNPAQLSTLREALESAQAQVLARLRLGERDAAAKELPIEAQDAASQEEMRQRAIASVQRDAQLAREIDAALKRMNEGSYGLCEETDEAIPYARLVAQPTTRYTVEGLESLGHDAALGAGLSEDPGAY